MTNKMLIDASHPEETRVVVLRGNRVEEFDFESASRRQLRGNIYLAKVMRVEPSLQAAFVDYGGNRHGFLAFSEIHPDYYEIPVADRQALIEEEARAQRDDEEEAARPVRRSRRFRRGERNSRSEKRREADPTLSGPYLGAGNDLPSSFDLPAAVEGDRPGERGEEEENAPLLPVEGGSDEDAVANGGHEFVAHPHEEILGSAGSPEEGSAEHAAPVPVGISDVAQDEDFDREPSLLEAANPGEEGDAPEDNAPADPSREASGHAENLLVSEGEGSEVEQLGGDAMEEMPIRPQRYRRSYKIQEVIKRRQILLVQVVKEERGNKGAALTTYLSLAGRYSVLMPNTARGGGISRKITDANDRQRLKSIAQELDVPEGMGVILRTAGAARTKSEVKRDFEYLLRMWETVRETTLKSIAPTLVYEEGSLIKRAIRDLYNKEIDEIIVAGEEGYREAKEFMRLLMPSHARMVQPYRDPQPMFLKSGAEAQLDAMFSNQVTLKSGGYIVINQTEALVAIDVNSGRSTREHNIEDTALRTNLEAADEIARQLRLRDLAGLIVIDFIDMEETRNNRTVERRLKEALKNDRARIQIGRMSHFGLLEMSRQRMRTGVLEGSTVACAHCGGAGMVRSTSSIALHVLRALEDALIRNSNFDIVVKTRTEVALYILNQKRAHLRELEQRFGAMLMIAADDSLSGTNYHALERGELSAKAREAAVPTQPGAQSAMAGNTFIETASLEELGSSDSPATDEPHDEADDSQEAMGDGEGRHRRRRRRGRGGERDSSGIAPNAPQPPDDALEAVSKISGLTRHTDFGHDLQPASDFYVDRKQDDASADRLAAPDRPASQEQAEGGSANAVLAPPAEDRLVEPIENAANAHKPPARMRRRRRTPYSLTGDTKDSSLVIDGEQGVSPSSSDQSISESEISHVSPQAQPDEAEPPGQDPYATDRDEAESPQPQSEDNEIPERLLEAPEQPEALDPARPKRSGWWQRARANWRS